MTRLGIILVFVLVSGGLRDAYGQNCDKLPQPQIVIAVTKSEVQELFDITGADLQRVAASLGRQPQWPGLGAYSTDLVYAADIDEPALKEPDGSYCSALGSLRLSITIKNRVIHLARELQQNHCLEEAQKQRSRRHAQADAQALEEFPIERELRELLSQLHPSHANSELSAKTQVTAAVHQKIRDLLDKIADNRAKIDQQIDAPEETNRLQHQVDNGISCR